MSSAADKLAEYARQPRAIAAMVIVVVAIVAGATWRMTTNNEQAPDVRDVPADVYRDEAPSGTAVAFQGDTGPRRNLDAGSPTADSGERAAPAREQRYTAGNYDPVRVVVGRLGIDADILPVGLNRDGSAEVPNAAADVGWYEPLGPIDDEGSNVLVGHVSWQGQRGVFSDIGELEPGDEIEVHTGGGNVLAYTVDTVEQYSKYDAPLADIYDPTGPERLVLITCGGEFNRRIGHYRDNIVVTAVPAGAGQTAPIAEGDADQS